MADMLPRQTPASGFKLLLFLLLAKWQNEKNQMHTKPGNVVLRHAL